MSLNYIARYHISHVVVVTSVGTANLALFRVCVLLTPRDVVKLKGVNKPNG